MKKFFALLAILLLIPSFAFAKSYNFIIQPGDPNAPIFHLTDYLKAPGDTLTAKYSDGYATYYYSFVSKGTDDQGDYIIVNEKIVYSFDTVTDQKKIYVPYVPHKIATVSYIYKDLYSPLQTKTEDIMSAKGVSDDEVIKNHLQQLYTDRWVRSITAINGVPIKNTKYWYFGNFLPQSKREELDDKAQGGAYDWPSIWYKIIVDGKEVDYTKYGAMPYVYHDAQGGGHTMIPYRALLQDGFEIPEKDIQYNNGKVTVKKGNTTIILQIGSKKAYVNGKAYDLPDAPTLMFDRTYIPLRFVSEVLGYKVDWQGEYDSGTVYINSK